MLANFAPYAGLLLGVIYTMGLITVTIHLNRYGITNVYLVQTKYLVVGTVFMIHITGLAVLAAPVMFVMSQLLGVTATGYISIVLGVLGILIVLASSFYAGDFEKWAERMTKRFPKLSSPILYWRIWHLSVFFSFILALNTFLRAYIFQNPTLVAAGAGLVIITIILGLVYYTLYLYHSPISVGNPVLELIGGGRPIQVRLILEKDAIPNLQIHGLYPVESDMSQPVYLIDETDHDLIILIYMDEKERALKLNKSAIQSVLYLP